MKQMLIISLGFLIFMIDITIQFEISMCSGEKDFMKSIARPPFLTLITPEGCCSKLSKQEENALLSKIEAAVQGGVSIVQLRDKSATEQQLVAFGRQLRSIIKTGEAVFMLNGNIEAALSCNADGIHLPEVQLASFLEKGQKISKQFKTIGCSVHSPKAARVATKAGASYLMVGTMFPTKSHPGKIPEGPKLISQIKEDLSQENPGTNLPYICAVGGITEHNCVEVVVNGADGVAMISNLVESDSPEVIAKAVKQQLQRATTD